MEAWVVVAAITTMGTLTILALLLRGLRRVISDRGLLQTAWFVWWALLVATSVALFLANSPPEALPPPSPSPTPSSAFGG